MSGFTISCTKLNILRRLGTFTCYSGIENGFLVTTSVYTKSIELVGLFIVGFTLEIRVLRKTRKSNICDLVHPYKHNTDYEPLF